MNVNAGAEAEYAQRHHLIWADLEAVLNKHGAHNYSIFLHRETRQLLTTVRSLLGWRKCCFIWIRCLRTIDTRFRGFFKMIQHQRVGWQDGFPCLVAEGSLCAPCNVEDLVIGTFKSSG